jgi:ATP-dependent Clp protease, protease subunit
MFKTHEEEYEGPAGFSPILDKIYQHQLQYREIILNDEVTEDVIELVVMQIFNINREDDELEAAAKDYDRRDNPITLYIHTDGGAVFDGLAVISAIRSSKTPIHTVALGKAISMGFMILIAGHKRFCQEFSTIMYHQLSSGNRGNLKDIEEYTEHLGDLQATLEALVKECTLLPQEMLDEVYIRKNDLYLSAAEALDWWVVDALI